MLKNSENQRVPGVAFNTRQDGDHLSMSLLMTSSRAGPWYRFFSAGCIYSYLFVYPLAAL